MPVPRRWRGSTRRSTLVSQAEEQGPLGVREVRAYQLAGTKFILVFEPFERRGAPRVATLIYLPVNYHSALSLS